MDRIVFISVPLKKSDVVDVSEPIERYFATTLGTSFTDENRSAVEEFAKMRESAVLRTLDRRESSLEPLFKYYIQLSALEAKLPISESGVQMKFTWYDAFLKAAISLYSSAFERINVLFNIAALYSQIAKAQNLESREGLDASCIQFQSAAGIFLQVKDIIHSRLFPLSDLSSKSLYALSAVMLAQAQESLYHKMILDQMTNSIYATVAAQTGDLYANAAWLIADPAVKRQWDINFKAIVTAKKWYFCGMAEFHQAQECKSNAKHGESIARYKLAYGCVKDAAKEGETFFHPGDVLNRIGRELSEAEKENNVIYKELIPASYQMNPIGRAVLAKATPLAFPASATRLDLVARIVPKTIHDAVVRYELQRETLVQAEVGKLREATQMLNGTLSSLILPAGIDDTLGDELPASLLAKAEAVRTCGGVNRLTWLLRELPEWQQRNKEVLDETSRMMAEEEQGDTATRERFHNKWTRRPSADLFKEHRAEIAKYGAILKNATQVDGILRAKYDTHVNGMTLLSKSEAELFQSVPKGLSGGSSVVAELKGLIEQVNSLKAARDKIESSLRDSTVDIPAGFMSALKADKTVAGESIAGTQLSETYGPLQQQVAESVAQQLTLVQSIDTVNQRFIFGGEAASAREGVLKDLAAAHDAFMELKENFREGDKFYSDLTRLLLKSQSKVADLIFARNKEKDNYVKDLLAESDTAPALRPREAPKPAPRKAPIPAPRKALMPTPRKPPESPPQQTQAAAPSPPQVAAAPSPVYAPQAPPSQGGYYQPNPYAPYPITPTYRGPPPQGSYPGYQGYQQPSVVAPQCYPLPLHGYQSPPKRPPVPQKSPRPAPALNAEKDDYFKLFENKGKSRKKIDRFEVKLSNDNSVQELLTTIRASGIKEDEEKLKEFSRRLLAWSQEANEALIVARREAEEAQASAQSAKERSERCEGTVAELRALCQEKEKRLNEQDDLLHIPLADVKMTTFRLGGGSYGEVKVGYWRGCPVAVKTFFECINSEHNLDLFKQEIAIGTRARHFNVVFLYGATMVNGTPIRIVTELLEGSLSDVIEASNRCKQPLSLREQIDLASGLTAGICYLHQLGPNGILHGDIRSKNVVVTSLMEAKICDLGAARFAAKVSSSAGPLSPEYLAPERKGCLVHNTKMADVYSLGVTVIELMIGQQPVVSRRIEHSLKVAHPDVKQMCLRLIEEDPSARPGADELLAVLERIQESRAYSECIAKRMVKGAFHGEGKMSLVLSPWAQRRLVRN